MQAGRQAAIAVHFKLSSSRPQVSPHIMILWRPDAGSYNSYLLREAPANATVDTNPAIQMSLSPSTKGEALQDKPFKLFNNVSGDDSVFFGFFCPAMVSGSLFEFCTAACHASPCDAVNGSPPGAGLSGCRSLGQGFRAGAWAKGSEQEGLSVKQHPTKFRRQCDLCFQTRPTCRGVQLGVFACVCCTVVVLPPCRSSRCWRWFGPL